MCVCLAGDLTRVLPVVEAFFGLFFFRLDLVLIFIEWLVAVMVEEGE